jgi:hypothetical protein
MANRVHAVTSHARGEVIASASAARQRRKVSCTTSSASAIEPSMR